MEYSKAFVAQGRSCSKGRQSSHDQTPKGDEFLRRVLRKVLNFEFRISVEGDLGEAGVWKQKKTERHRCIKNYFRYRHDKPPERSRICLNAIAMMENIGGSFYTNWNQLFRTKEYQQNRACLRTTNIGGSEVREIRRNQCERNII